MKMVSTKAQSRGGVLMFTWLPRSGEIRGNRVGRVSVSLMMPPKRSLAKFDSRKLSAKNLYLAIKYSSQNAFCD